jgi:hypothetical protein
MEAKVYQTVVTRPLFVICLSRVRSLASKVDAALIQTGLQPGHTGIEKSQNRFNGLLLSDFEEIPLSETSYANLLSGNR